MLRPLLVCTCFVLCSEAVRPETPAPVLALNGLDPIALADGKEVPGLETLEATYGRFKYRFATPENKKAFEARPEERCIQFGGACGKMGPFSGTGNPTRYFVHDRRIYIFASEGCRDGFKLAPEKHIDRPNPVPTGTADQKKRGTALLEQVLVGFGGARKVDGLKSLETIQSIRYGQGEMESVASRRVSYVFPDRARIESDYGTPYGIVVRADGGFEFVGEKTWPLEPGMRAEGWRQVLRDPLVVLRNRTAEGFVAVARGEDTVRDTPVELLDVAIHGTTTTWSVDPKTGRILRVAFVARRGGAIGENVVIYGDFRTVDGLVLPYSRTEFFDGKELTSSKKTIDRIVADGDIKPDLFKQPK